MIVVADYVNGGELFTHLYQREKFTENEVRIYIGEIVLALEELHKNGIIYRDIKLENILLDGDGHIVLTDFGMLSRLITVIIGYCEQSLFVTILTCSHQCSDILRQIAYCDIFASITIVASISDYLSFIRQNKINNAK